MSHRGFAYFNEACKICGIAADSHHDNHAHNTPALSHDFEESNEPAYGLAWWKSPELLNQHETISRTLGQKAMDILRGHEQG